MFIFYCLLKKKGSVLLLGQVIGEFLSAVTCFMSLGLQVSLFCLHSPFSIVWLPRLDRRLLLVTDMLGSHQAKERKGKEREQDFCGGKR